jgi:segregation and condensation protein A
MIETAIEEYIKEGEKERTTLLTIPLIEIVHNEIARIKKGTFYDISVSISQLSFLIKLKSELLLMLFDLLKFGNRAKELLEDEEITEIFSVLQKNLKDIEFEKKQYMEETDETEIPLLRLSKIVKEILEREKLFEQKEMLRNDISIQEITEKVKEKILKNKKLKFKVLLMECTSKIEVVVTFLAILMLSRSKFLKITQKTHFSEIYIELYEKRRIPASN